MTSIKITGSIDQIQKLPLLNIYTKTIEGGLVVVNMDFESVDEAKEYLIVRSLMFHQNSKSDMDQAVDDIENQGFATYGTVIAKIE